MARHAHGNGTRKGAKQTLPRNLYLRDGGPWIYMKFQIQGYRKVNQSTDVRIDQPYAIKAAVEKLELARSNVRRGLEPGDTRHTRTWNLRDTCDLFLAHRRNDLDLTKVRRCVLLCEFFGELSNPATITSAQVERYVDARLAAASPLGKTITPNTVKRELNVLRLVLKHGNTEGLFAMPDYREPPLRILPRDKKCTAGKLHDAAQVNAFIAGLPPVWRALFTFARLTGARSTELLRLTPAQVHLGRNPCIHLRETKTKIMRTLPLSPAAVEAVKVGLALKKDRVWPLKFVASRVYGFNKQAGRQGDDRITLRDMRHETCTRMANSGMPIPIIMAQLGHTNIATTQKYMHAEHNATQSQLRAFWEALEPSAPGHAPAA